MNTNQQIECTAAEFPKSFSLRPRVNMLQLTTAMQWVWTAELEKQLYATPVSA